MLENVKEEMNTSHFTPSNEDDFAAVHGGIGARSEQNTFDSLNFPNINVLRGITV